MFGLVLSEDRMSFRPRRQEIINCLKNLPDLIKEVLQQDDKVLTIAKQLYQNRSVLIMGRGYNFSTCLEGALKIKELTYMHCEGIYTYSNKGFQWSKLHFFMHMCNLFVSITL